MHPCGEQMQKLLPRGHRGFMSLETDMLWAQQLYLAADFFSYLQGQTMERKS